MRNKIRLALFALCTAVVSGTAELYADERIPAATARQTAEASQYDIVYQENHTHTIAPAGETFSLDLLSVAQKMYTAIGLPDGPFLGYGVETRLTGLQQLQFGTDWTEGKTALTLDFKPNNGMDALSNTLDIYVIANTTSTGGIRPAALVRVTFSQAPVTVYSTGAIQGLRMEETTYNGTMQTKKVSHFDRAGRLVQETALSASPSGNDIIRFYRYDCMNRGDSVTYLPYTLEETGGLAPGEPRSGTEGLLPGVLYGERVQFCLLVQRVRHLAARRSRQIRRTGQGVQHRRRQRRPLHRLYLRPQYGSGGV